eukprot:gnl/TRDRNA2_/TRDRNA2_41673_c0_seq1.p2 gnl/TRDRNA2_/TRDRNA2_41673_c0~~gnl/TRDRNA2_/TRDRNA2_41673_c0_seq1.p2  ORF type:complete len:152 (+),score=40.04 gnl/TRDRNA2_/TRDRNA2_41673_c0_seq1:68-523(+)
MGQALAACKSGGISAKTILKMLVPMEVSNLPGGLSLNLDKATLGGEEDGEGVAISMGGFTLEEVVLAGKGGTEQKTWFGIPLCTVPAVECDITIKVKIQKELAKPACEVSVLDMSTDNQVVKKLLNGGVEGVIKGNIEKVINDSISGGAKK